MPTRERDIAVDCACTYADKLQQLYATLSESFPDDRALWQTLAGEQARHVGWLQQIRTLHTSKAMALDTSQIHVSAMESAIPYMEVILQKVRRRQWPYGKVIDEVRDLEQNLLECGLLRALQASNGDHLAMIQQLSQGIEQHHDRLLDKLMEQTSG